MKTISTLLSFAFPFVGLGQIDLAKYVTEVPRTLDIISSYFMLDSAFVRENNISKVICMEKYTSGRKIIYQKPLLDYRYDERARMIHNEFNYWRYWDVPCFTSRYNDATYTGNKIDSVMSVTQERYRNSNGLISDSKWIRRIRHIDDTLTHTLEYNYLNDSLVSFRDQGIHDSKAQYREWAKQQNSSPVVQEIEVEEPRGRDCSLGSLRPSEPPTKIEKDSLNRIRKMSVYDVVNESGITKLMPVIITSIEYYESTNTIQSIQVNYLNHRENNKRRRRSIGADVVVYLLIANNFEFGIPTKIVVKRGGGETVTYSTIIKRR